MHEADNLRKSQAVEKTPRGKIGTLDGLLSARDSTYDLLNKKGEGEEPLISARRNYEAHRNKNNLSVPVGASARISMDKSY